MTDKPTHTPLPCPFCGSAHVSRALTSATDKFLGYGEDNNKLNWFAHVKCLNCGTKQGYLESYPMSGPNDEDAYTEALTAWNTRAVNSHHDLIEALRECGQAIEVLFETADDRVTGVSCIALDMLKDAAKNARAILTKAEAGHG